ncbi:MAG TPA: tRNA (guanosine(37)-N1)-methyltransferase TrmD [Candidatus Acidoferrales bacterium]|nr:tRNA (guanosine(37)-N1)-methyltransferase TrmD [Candidatus Acidoferrales bacterium]
MSEVGIRFDVISVFPELFGPVFERGVVGRAVQKGLITLAAHDLRDFTHDAHRQVDDSPFGGGAGMLLKPEPIFAAVSALRSSNPGPVVLLEPWGEPLTQELAADLARQPGLILICGRYEGVDDRVRQGLADREISIGEYVLSGAEIPAMVLIDCVARLCPGVLGEEESLTQDSFGSGPGGYPQFTRPADFQGFKVPEVLLSGNHQEIARWRRAHARGRSGRMTELIP